MTDIEQALVAAHRELIAAELAYCRAAVYYASFIYRHSTTLEDKKKWEKTCNLITEQYRKAQAVAIKIGMVETGPSIPTPEVSNADT